jgi:D-glycero-alpha-D-manno-heptose-7-phosphate kinase
MLIARAPMHISLGGGGTDVEAYYARYGGIVISAAINKYFYAIITSTSSLSEKKQSGLIWSGE